MTAQLDRDIFGNLLSRKEPAGTRRHYHFDGLGSTTALSDEAGIAASTLLYDAWGNQRAATGATMPNYRFTGAELDSASGLYHMGARFYDPTIGRWLGEDPLQSDHFNPQSLNFYAYAMNSPTGLTDLDGESVFDAIFGTHIHTQVLEYLTARYSALGAEGRVWIRSCGCQADLVLWKAPGGTQVYEIKPISWHVGGYRQRHGEQQLANYAKHLKANTKLGQMVISSGGSSELLLATISYNEWIDIDLWVFKDSPGMIYYNARLSAKAMEALGQPASVPAALILALAGIIALYMGLPPSPQPAP
jgi:RHS repeat-associated protein